MKRLDKAFTLDSSRVIIKSHIPSDTERIKRIITRILNLSNEEADSILKNIVKGFSGRHKNIWDPMNKYYNRIPPPFFFLDLNITDTKRALLGAYFSQEYTIQSAAFFNFSIVEPPGQSQTPE